MKSDTTLGGLVKHGRDDRSFVSVDPIANGRQGLRELSDVPINSGGRSSRHDVEKKKGKKAKKSDRNKSMGLSTVESWRGKTPRFHDRSFVPFDPISIRISLLSSNHHLSFKVPLQLTDNTTRPVFIFYFPLATFNQAVFF